MMMNTPMMVNPTAQMLMPLCQGLLSAYLPKAQAEEAAKPLAIQLDEQFAAMAERYFDNLYDGRMPVPHQFAELVKRCCGTHEHHGEKAPHRVFMAAVDKLVLQPGRADEIIAEHFDGATDAEKCVLKQYAKGRTLMRVQAQAVNMTEDAYCGHLEHLMNKTKT